MRPGSIESIRAEMMKRVGSRCLYRPLCHGKILVRRVIGVVEAASVLGVPMTMFVLDDLQVAEPTQCLFIIAETGSDLFGDELAGIPPAEGNQP